MERQTQDTPKASCKARDFPSGNIPAGQWRNIHDELELIAGKERASVEYDTGNRKPDSEDLFLHAHYNYFPDRDSRWPKGTPRPPFHLWDLTHGPTEDIRAQFVDVANRIGKLLGCPQGTDPLHVTLYHLLTSLQENKSSYLKFPDEDGGIILHVCEALMAFCSRRAGELEAAEPTAEPQPTEGYPGETTDSGERLEQAPAQPSPATVANGGDKKDRPAEALKLERPQDMRGKKPSRQIIDRTRDIARLAFEGQPPLAIAVYLDDCNYPTPKTWRTAKFAPKGEKFETGIRVPKLLKCFRELISKAKRKYPVPTPVPN